MVVVVDVSGCDDLSICCRLSMSRFVDVAVRRVGGIPGGFVAVLRPLFRTGEFSLFVGVLSTAVCRFGESSDCDSSGGSSLDVISELEDWLRVWDFGAPFVLVGGRVEVVGEVPGGCLSIPSWLRG